MIVTEQITIAGQNALHFYTTERKNILATALVRALNKLQKEELENKLYGVTKHEQTA